MTSWTVGQYSPSDSNAFHSGWPFFFFWAETLSFGKTHNSRLLVSFLPSNSPPVLPVQRLTPGCHHLGALVAGGAAEKRLEGSRGRPPA